MIDITSIDTPGLGDRSYLITDGQSAVVVDPQRDIDRYLALAQEKNVQIEAICETHMHNDYVSGGLPLSRVTGAALYVNEADPIAFEANKITEGDEIKVGSLTIKVIATPGHTFNHLAYAVVDNGETKAVFTGGSLLYGSTGRTDLISQETANPLAHHQYHSAHKLAELGEAVEIYPTHGFGSFCSATQTTGDASTIANEKKTNPVFLLDEDKFVSETLANLVPYPRYYAHMGYFNLNGGLPADLSAPKEVDSQELANRLKGGEWVVDVRSRVAYAKGHLAGSVGIEMGSLFVNYFGWTIPWGSRITLVGDNPEQILDAHREIVRIGLDTDAQFHGNFSEVGEISSYDVVDFEGLAKALEEGKDLAILDVRQKNEWESSHIEGSINIPIQDVQQRINEIPNKPIWVHCAGGFRASVAASFLDRKKLPVVAIDDSFDNASKTSLKLVS